MSDKAAKFRETFSGWDEYYEKTNVKEMPWYEENLDQDVVREFRSKEYRKGNFLDLGTGPGTQALQLSKHGFKVTGTDVSENAIRKARELSDDVDFVVDDILDSKLDTGKFDFILDRGIFHTFELSQRSLYLQQVKRILKDNGILFLKCMSIDEKTIPDDGMPRKLSKQDLREFFEDDFDIQRIDDASFRGTMETELRALFAVLKKRL